MAGLPGDPPPPNGSSAQDAVTSDPTPPAQEYQLPDCIIVSSNRFNDIRPYCDNIYYKDPKKWSAIMPWEYPYKPTHQQDAEFLREWFSETEIHMQGGAHGPGNGFRFLKQVWISIALWNWEKRMPSIADWWLQQEENQSVIADLAMRQYLLSPDVTPETFFESSQIEQYGTKLLGLVVKQIQAIVKAKEAGHMPSAGEIESTLDAQTSSRGQDVDHTKVPLPVQPLPASQETQQNIDAQRIVSPPTTNFTGNSGPTIPFPPYKEPSDTSRPTNAGYSQTPADQPYGQKRGFGNGRRFSSGGGSRFNVNARQIWQPQDRNMTHNTDVAFDPIATNFNNFMSNRAQSQAFTPDAPPANVTLLPPPSMGPGFMNPGMTSGFAGHDPSSIQSQRMMRDSLQFEPQYGGMLYDTGSVQTRRGGAFDKRNFTHESTFPGSDGYASSFVHNRRSSQGSRSGSYRGQSRGGRGRGRGRGSFNESTNPMEAQAFNRIPGDHSAASTYNNRLRRGDTSRPAYRGHSDRPQEENVLPFAPPNWSQYPDSYGSVQPTPAEALGAQHQDVANVFSARQPAGHPPFPVIPAANEPAGQYMGISKDQIPEDARHVFRLVVFNIPRAESSTNVKRNIAEVCGVEVTGVLRPKKSLYEMDHDEYTQAHIDLPSHHAARRVLQVAVDGAKLYGKDLKVEVARQFWDTGHRDFGRSNFPEHSNFQSGSVPQPSAAAFVPSQMSRPSPSAMLYGRYQESLQDVRVDPGTTFENHFMHGQNATFHNMTQMPPLSTVQSANTTPTASGDNTPKKRKQKNKNKMGRKDGRTDPRTSVTQATSDSTADDAHTGPSKTPERKHGAHHNLLGDDAPPTSTALPMANNHSAQLSATIPVAGDADIIHTSNDVPHTPTSSDKTVKTRSPVRGQTDGADSTTGEEDSPQTPRSSQKPRQYPAPTANVSESEQADDSFHTARDTPPAGEVHESTSANSSKKTGDSKPQTTPSSSINAKVATPTRPLRKADITVNIPSSAPGETKAVEPSADKQPAFETTDQRTVSSGSILPTSAFQTAPTTPALPTTGTGPTSQPVPKEIASGQKSKATEKQKGPATTESFSMFGKKQAKKTRAGKGQKQPSSRPRTEAPAQPKDLSDALTKTKQPKSPGVGGEPTKKAQYSAQGTAPNRPPQPTAPSSPSRRSLASFLSFIPGMTSKTPSNASKSVRSEASNELELTDSKAKPAQSLAVPSIDLDGTDKAQVSGTESTKDTTAAFPAPSTENSASAYEPKGADATTLVLGDELDPNKKIATTKDLQSSESAGVGSSSATETTTNDTQGGASSGLNSGKQSKKKKKSKKKKASQDVQQDATKTLEGEANTDNANVTVTTAETVGEINENQSDGGSEDSSRTMGRPTPPISPPNQRLAAMKRVGTDHIITAPPPRNKHVKRQSSSRLSSETSSQATSESKDTISIENYRKSDIGRRTGQMIQLYTLRDTAAAWKSQMADGDEGEPGDDLEDRRRVWLLTAHPDDTAAEPTRLTIFGPVEGLEIIEDGSGNEGRVVEEADEEEQATTEALEASSVGTTEAESEVVHSDE